MANTNYPIDVRDALYSLGGRIAVARKASELRQADLADRAGISRSTLVEIEKGSPYVAIGNYFAVLWALDVLGDADKIAAIELDSHRLMASKLPQRIRHG